MQISDVCKQSIYCAVNILSLRSVVRHAHKRNCNF